MRRIVVAVLVASLAWVTPSLAFTIDDFEVALDPYLEVAGNQAAPKEDFGVTDAPTSWPQSLSILGGQREALLQMTAGTKSSHRVNVFIEDGEFSQGANNTAANSVSFLTWDGTGDSGAQGVNIAGLGGVDMTYGNVLNAVILNGTTTSSQPTDLWLTMWDMDGRSATVQRVLPAAVTGRTMTYHYYEFTTATPGFDMTRIGAIELKTGPRAGGGDVSLSWVEATTVPEPGSLALMGVLGGIGWMMRRRSARKTQATV